MIQPYMPQMSPLDPMTGGQTDPVAIGLNTPTPQPQTGPTPEYNLAASLGLTSSDPSHYLPDEDTPFEKQYKALTAQHYDLFDQLANTNDPKGFLAGLHSAAMEGTPPQDAMAAQSKNDQMDQIGQFIQYVKDRQTKDQGAYDTAISRLNQELGQAPQVPGVPPLVQPNLTQGILSGLGAVLDPWHAASNAAAPFETGLQMQDLQYKRGIQQYDMKRQGWQDQMQQIEHMAAMANQAKEAGMGQLATLLGHQAQMAYTQVYRDETNRRLQEGVDARKESIFNQAWNNPRASVEELTNLAKQHPEHGYTADDAVKQWQNVHSEGAKKDWQVQLSKFRNWAGFISPADSDRLESQRQGVISKYGLDDSDLEKPLSEAGMRKQLADQNLNEFNQRFGLAKDKFNEQLANDKANRDIARQKLVIAQQNMLTSRGSLSEKQAEQQWRQQVQAYNMAEGQYKRTIDDALKIDRFHQRQDILQGDLSGQYNIPKIQQPTPPKAGKSAQGATRTGNTWSYTPNGAS